MFENLLRGENINYQTGRRQKYSSYQFSGEVALNSKHIILHPNFLEANINLGFNPMSRKDNYLVFPDQTETKTLRKIETFFSFFQYTPTKLNLFYNYQRSYINRELISDYEFTLKSRGATFAFSNSVLPVSVTYRNTKSKNLETVSNRELTITDKNITFNANRNFGKNQTHSIQYTYRDLFQNYYNQDTIAQYIHNFQVQDIIRGKIFYPFRLNSFINIYRQTGFFDYKKMTSNQTLNYMLPYNLVLNSGYQFLKLSQFNVEFIQNNFNFQLEHQLYASLHSTFKFMYVDTKQSSFRESYPQYMLQLNYRKKIPYGNLLMNYTGEKQDLNREGLSLELQIIDESHVLSDNEIVLLNYPFVNPSSVVVTDETGTIYYQENLDYLLVPRGDYLEIQRVPGGQIANGQTVLVDYTAVQQGNYQVGITRNFYSIRINMLQNLFEIYFSHRNQTGDIDTDIPGVPFETVFRNNMGFTIRYHGFTGGYDYVSSNSSILPYDASEFSLQGSGLIRKVTLSGGFSYRLYHLVRENENQKFYNISFQVVYPIKPDLTFKFQNNLRIQRGNGLDLDLNIIRFEMEKHIQKLRLASGFQYYKKTYLDERRTFNGFYLRAWRMF